MHPSEVFVVGVCDDVSHLRRGSGCAERRQNSGSGECGKLHICWQDEEVLITSGIGLQVCSGGPKRMELSQVWGQTQKESGPRVGKCRTLIKPLRVHVSYQL